MSEVDQINIELSAAKEHVKVRDALQRLENNADFHLVIGENYFKKEASRLVMARSNPSLSPELQDNILKMIDGIGCLAQYLDEIHRRGSEMDQAVSDYEEAIEEAAQEELM